VALPYRYDTQSDEQHEINDAAHDSPAHGILSANVPSANVPLGNPGLSR
jgi:hypothetical protein